MGHAMVVFISEQGKYGWNEVMEYMGIVGYVEILEVVELLVVGRR